MPLITQQNLISKNPQLVTLELRSAQADPRFTSTASLRLRVILIQRSLFTNGVLLLYYKKRLIISCL